MFDRSAIEEYRAVKAPAALKARVETLNPAQKPKTQILRFLPIAAAVAACLVLAIVGFIPGGAPAVTITAAPISAMARSSMPEPLFSTPLTLQANGIVTLEHADVPLTDELGNPLTLPCSAENELTVLWTIEAPQITLTVNGQTFTLCADTAVGRVTVN